jgi:hypothetical protein
LNVLPLLALRLLKHLPGTDLFKTSVTGLLREEYLLLALSLDVLLCLLLVAI